MRIRDFQLERYFAKYEFSARYLLSPSDCEPLAMRELLAMASGEDAKLWDELVLAYTESPGHPELRARIAGMHHGLTADNVLCAVPEEAVFLAMNSLLEPGDRVVAVQPAYQSLQEVARSIGCQVDLWPLTRQGQGWALDLEALEQTLKNPVKLLVINFPHNPTGFQPSREEFETVLSMAEAAGARVFSDEMYRGLEFSGDAPLPSVAEVSDTAVALSGLSKTYALPGLRSGWLICRDKDFLDRAQALKDYTTICAPGPSEILSIIALANREAIAERSRALVRENLGRIREFFTARKDAFTLIEPMAGSICVAELIDGRDAYAFCEEAVQRESVMVVPSKAFDMDGEYIRLGLGRKTLPLALEALGKYLER
jgi:aspartate/methionine/tyrosine aminotransferase